MAKRDRLSNRKTHFKSRNKNPKLSPFQKEQKRDRLANQPPLQLKKTTRTNKKSRGARGLIAENDDSGWIINSMNGRQSGRGARAANTNNHHTIAASVSGASTSDAQSTGSSHSNAAVSSGDSTSSMSNRTNITTINGASSSSASIGLTRKDRKNKYKHLANNNNTLGNSDGINANRGGNVQQRIELSSSNPSSATKKQKAAVSGGLSIASTINANQDRVNDVLNDQSVVEYNEKMLQKLTRKAERRIRKTQRIRSGEQQELAAAAATAATAAAAAAKKKKRAAIGHTAVIPQTTRLADVAATAIPADLVMRHSSDDDNGEEDDHHAKGACKPGMEKVDSIDANAAKSSTSKKRKRSGTDDPDLQKREEDDVEDMLRDTKFDFVRFGERCDAPPVFDIVPKHQPGLDLDIAQKTTSRTKEQRGKANNNASKEEGRRLLAKKEQQHQLQRESIAILQQKINAQYQDGNQKKGAAKLKDHESETTPATASSSMVSSSSTENVDQNDESRLASAKFAPAVKGAKLKSKEDFEAYRQRVLDSYSKAKKGSFWQERKTGSNFFQQNYF